MSPARYRRLGARMILRTIRSVKGRIDARFPGSGVGARWVSSLIILSILQGSCGQVPRDDPQEDPAAVPPEGAPYSLAVIGVGLSTPESVLHDPEADVYLVANINGPAAEKDGNGFISRISPEGEVLELNWIDGASPGVTLHAPKGMAIVADTLFVADIDCIRRFHRLSGAPLRELCMGGVTFLNDLASSSRGDLYFTDSGSEKSPGAVYILRHTADVPQKVALADGTILEGDLLGGPNGIYSDGRELIVATAGSGELFRVTSVGERAQLLPPSEMVLDGIVSIAGRGLLVSSWGDSAVYWVHSEGTVSPLIQNVEAPADIGYDAVRNRVLIPLFRANELIFLEVR